MQGWHAPSIVPYGPLAIDPACSGLQYGIAGFEGMKAYRAKDGRLLLFRPDKNMARLAASMERLSLPPLDRAGFLACLKALVREEQSWVPEGDGYSLYIRPTVLGMQPTLGVTKPGLAKLYAITCPVGPYYPEGFKPVRLLAESDATRAWPGGTGDRKIGGNYAPTIAVQAAAAARGYAQVLWLFGPEGHVTEVGTMNFFVLWRNEAGEREMVTAPLDGTILPGVTRDSMLALARGWGEFKVSERPFTMPQLVAALREGRVEEAWGAGTAAVVSPVKCIAYKGVDHAVPLDAKDASAGAGPVVRRFWKELGDIMYGEVRHEWSVEVPRA